MVPCDIYLNKSTLLSKSDSRKNVNETLEESSSNEKQSSLSSISVKAYIGMDYECPLGHRFICSGPDRLVKASSNGIIKVCFILFFKPQNFSLKYSGLNLA